MIILMQDHQFWGILTESNWSLIYLQFTTSILWLYYQSSWATLESSFQRMDASGNSDHPACRPSRFRWESLIAERFSLRFSPKLIELRSGVGKCQRKVAEGFRIPIGHCGYCLVYKATLQPLWKTQCQYCCHPVHPVALVPCLTPCWAAIKETLGFSQVMLHL